MGLPALWEELGDGEVTNIAQFATEHFERTGRPLRIAIDEAHWRFRNLNPQQVAAIRQGVAASNPVQKAILYRIIGLLRMNIQLLFVFDGPNRPAKRGGHAANGFQKPEILKETKLLKDMLRELGVPWWDAPAEAEAECARFQQLNIVDAVWSDDGDALMFGCTLLFRFHYAKTGKKGINQELPKSKTEFRVYRSSWVHQKLGLNQKLVLRNCLVLFAILVGGDYDTKGLPGCGSKIALEAIRKAPDLAKAICEASDEDIPRWRGQLFGCLKNIGSNVRVPQEFPSFKVANLYRAPDVYSQAQIQAKRQAMRLGPIDWNKPEAVEWSLPVNEEQLREILGTRFNWWMKEYIKDIIPIRLVQALAQTSPGQEASNKCYKIEHASKRRKNGALETKITFLLSEVTGMDFTEWSAWCLRTIGPDKVIDYTERVEAEVLSCILKHAVPDMMAEERTKLTQAMSSTTGTDGGKKRGRPRKENEEVRPVVKKPKAQTSETKRSEEKSLPNFIDIESSPEPE